MDVLRFALLGLGVGAIYALAAQGIVLIYRGSGVLNFAHGAIAMVGAYFYYELHVRHHQEFLLSLAIGTAASALVGAATHLLVMRRLRTASPLVRLVATLGVLLTLQAAAVLRYGADALTVPSVLPTRLVYLTHGAQPLVVTSDRLYLLAIAVFLTVALAWVYSRTRFGLATSAVAENTRSAAALGHSPDIIAAVNWAIGCGLAGLAAILIVGIVSLQVTIFTTLVLSALAAALVAGFRSFPLTLVAGVAIGVGQSELSRFANSTTGLADSLPVLVIISVIVLRGRALPLRSFVLSRIPSVGSGRIRPLVLLPTLVVSAVIVLDLSKPWVIAVTNSLMAAIVLLSLVVVVGYAGQLSLAQFTLAGLGAYICGRLDGIVGVPLPLAFVTGIVGAGLIGGIFALPAVRTRGANLAVVTLGMGTVVGAMLFNNVGYSGGDVGTPVHTPHLFGLSLSAISHPARYALVVLFWYVVAAIAVANLRRGRVGRRLLAIRTNERAAAALGISVWQGKAYAFALAAAIAGLGGILFAYQSPSIVFSDSFVGTQSITYVALAVIGGIGSLAGPLFGGGLADGGFGGQVGNTLFSHGFQKYLPLIAGVNLLLFVLAYPDGMIEAHVAGAKALFNRVWKRRSRRLPGSDLEEATAATPRVAPTKLEVRNLKVRFGGVVAVNNATLTVSTGVITGLIGPNGSGKTTIIDAITGFVRPAAGELLVNGEGITGRSAVWRARNGLSRSFQSLELFEDMTVRENLRTASDRRDLHGYLTTLVYPGRSPMSDELVAAIREFGLADLLDKKVKELSYGQRRLVGLARAVAVQPAILLLDEPTTGLSHHETAEVGRLLRRLVESWRIGVLLVEHDMPLVMSVCDELVVLNFGEVIASGSPEDARRDPAVIAAYLGDQTAEPVASAARREPSLG